MKLRNWQAECINSALLKYQEFKKHFLVLATPAAGKTHMASVLAKKMHELDMIDLVMCFSPSSVVSSDFSESLVGQFGKHFDGTIGALGDSFTYQKLGTLENKTWRLFEQYRVFVIFDEIHHCSGSNERDSNAWGAPIIKKIKNLAAFSLALTGTPWRSDALPIVLSNYCNDSGKIQCDYTYGLKLAIEEKVCRVPQIVAIDNDKITVTNKKKSRNFNSFSDLLSKNMIPYSQIVTNDLVIEQLLKRAITKLDELREVNGNAGGLVVSSSIMHAKKIQRAMHHKFGEKATIVTSNEIKPSSIIQQFRTNNDKWLISVGMVSEGTNIPRLQVCCNLTNVKTEMYFRQILGRILRRTCVTNQEAYLFIPAEPNLVKYAFRVTQDIPDGLNIVKFETMDEGINAEFFETSEAVDGDSNSDEFDQPENNVTLKINTCSIEEKTNFDESQHNDKGLNKKNKVDATRIMGIIGNFRQQVLEIEDCGLLQISTRSMERLSELSSVEF